MSSRCAHCHPVHWARHALLETMSSTMLLLVYVRGQHRDDIVFLVDDIVSMCTLASCTSSSTCLTEDNVVDDVCNCLWQWTTSWRHRLMCRQCRLDVHGCLPYIEADTYHLRQCRRRCCGMLVCVPPTSRQHRLTCRRCRRRCAQAYPRHHARHASLETMSSTMFELVLYPHIEMTWSPV